MQILRLTRSPIPDTEHTICQADMVSALALRRDMLMHQAEEQRLRWTSGKGRLRNKPRIVLTDDVSNHEEFLAENVPAFLWTV